jgi:hypothetical protein
MGLYVVTYGIGKMLTVGPQLQIPEVRCNVTVPAVYTVNIYIYELLSSRNKTDYPTENSTERGGVLICNKSRSRHVASCVLRPILLISLNLL